MAQCSGLGGLLVTVTVVVGEGYLRRSAKLKSAIPRLLHRAFLFDRIAKQLAGLGMVPIARKQMDLLRLF